MARCDLPVPAILSSASSHISSVARYGPNVGCGCFTRRYSNLSRSKRSAPLTVLRDQPKSRAIALIDSPCTSRRRRILPIVPPGRSVAPLECNVLQLATALNLQHYRLSSSHRLKQRPDLLNGFNRLLVYLVNDVPREQVRCVSVQAWRPRNS